jgi:hypothetical protein
MSKFSGMTVNERLFDAGLLAEWDAATQRQDCAAMERLLSQVELADQADSIIKTFLKQQISN